MSEKFGNDKRQLTRIRSKIPMKYEKFDPLSKVVLSKDTLTKDISSGGILFESEEIFPLGSELKVTLFLPGLDRDITVNTKIIRVEETESGKQFAVGATFIQITDVDKQEIVKRIEQMDIRKLLEVVQKKDASDLHLTTGYPPILRIQGKLEALKMEKIDSEDMKRLLFSIMSDQQIAKFEETKELDFGFSPSPTSRFRVNIHQQRGSVEGAFRSISAGIPTLAQLGLPPVVEDLARQKDGIVIIAGPTGSGKTTTLAAMIDLINHERRAVVICLERPIEYLHTNINSIVKQREVGIDTVSFSSALKSSLRQDPNVILVGELDDPETIKTAVIAAEAGYLVLTSIHAPNTSQAIDRLTSMISMEYKKQILSQLSRCLKGIVTQLLLPRQDGKGRVIASEIVITTDAVRRVLRDDDMVQMANIIQMGGAYKMQSMADSIRKLYESGIINGETAETFSLEFKRYT
jgi:twitching motility protein PilT